MVQIEQKRGTGVKNPSEYQHPHQKLVVQVLTFEQCSESKRAVHAFDLARGVVTALD